MYWYACSSSHSRPSEGSTFHNGDPSPAQPLTLLNPALLAGTSLPFLTFSTGSVNRL